MRWLALDIGGANLKAADGLGWARSMPFSMWREPERLAGVIGEFVKSAPESDRFAVTMTGELCDVFRTKSEGVRHILTAVGEVAAGAEVTVYLVNGRMVPLEAACELPHLAAASNWHAMATFAGRFIRGRAGMLIDIGSTTTDLIPITDQRPAARGRNDSERLLSGELVYTGIGRTPICAVTRTLPFRGTMCPLAAEVFATTADAYLLLGKIVEQPLAEWTADGRPLTLEFAHERLARMLCADRTTFDADDARRAAEFVYHTQLAQLRCALAEVMAAMPTSPDWFVVSGSGEFLAQRLVQEVQTDDCIVATVSVTERVGREISVCAPAHALAVLAREGTAE